MTATPENLTLTVSAESLVPIVEKAVERALDDRDVGDPVRSVQFVADYCGVKPHTVYQWLREGRLTRVNLGNRCIRIRQSEIERFLNEHTSDHDDVIERVLGGAA